MAELLQFGLSELAKAADETATIKAEDLERILGKTDSNGCWVTDAESLDENGLEAPVENGVKVKKFAVEAGD